MSVTPGAPGQTHQGEVVLAVDDEGPGVPDDVGSRMFQDFFTTRTHGAGIGLAVVRRIMEDHEAMGPASRVERSAFTAGPASVSPSAPTSRDCARARGLQPMLTWPRLWPRPSHGYPCTLNQGGEAAVQPANEHHRPGVACIETCNGNRSEAKSHRHVDSTRVPPRPRRRLVQVGLLALASPARADDPQGFIQSQHTKLQTLLHAPASAGRDAQVNAALDGFVDYDELVRRAFGEPCHVSMPTAATILWGEVQRRTRSTSCTICSSRWSSPSYRKNLTKTLDYDVSASKGSRDAGGDTRVQISPRPRARPTRAADTPVRVDYMVKQTAHGPRVVDIITEGSSFSKNLYVQFRKMDDYGKDRGEAEGEGREEGLSRAAAAAWGAGDPPR